MKTLSEQQHSCVFRTSGKGTAVATIREALRVLCEKPPSGRLGQLLQVGKPAQRTASPLRVYKPGNPSNALPHESR